MNDTTETAKSSPYFSIVIPAYNEEEHVGSCLQAIFDSDYDSSEYEVIVVDNGSTDRTYEIALNSQRAKVFQLLEGNIGAVRNYGAKKARGEILVFIDADCLIDKDWLNRAEKLTRERPNCAYGGGVKLPSNATWIETSWLLEKNGRPTLPKHLIGASTMIPKELFFSVGGFDERVSSGEDTDLHNLLASKNIPVFIDYSLSVTHLGNAKTPIQFIRRQIWHSENYLSNITTSFKDPVFIITLAFIISLSLLFIQAIYCSGKSLFIINLSLFAFLPMLLSCKRIYRSKSYMLGPTFLLKIYFLDLLYLVGRSVGLLSGTFRKAS